MSLRNTTTTASTYGNSSSMTSLEAIGFTALLGFIITVICHFLFGHAVKRRSPVIAPRCFARPPDVIYNPSAAAAAADTTEAAAHKNGERAEEEEEEEVVEGEEEEFYDGSSSIGSIHVQNRGRPAVGYIKWTLGLSYDDLMSGVPGTGTREGGLAGRMLNVNLDGIVILRFHALCLRVVALTTILCLGIVLPINVTAQCVEVRNGGSLLVILDKCASPDPALQNATLTNYARTTLANIPPVLSSPIVTTTTTTTTGSSVKGGAGEEGSEHSSEFSKQDDNNSTTGSGSGSGSGSGVIVAPAGGALPPRVITPSTYTSSYYYDLNLGLFERAVWHGGNQSAGTLARLYTIVLCSWAVYLYACGLLRREWKDLMALRRVYYLENDVWRQRKEELADTFVNTSSRRRRRPVVRDSPGAAATAAFVEGRGEERRNLTRHRDGDGGGGGDGDGDGDGDVDVGGDVDGEHSVGLEMACHVSPGGTLTTTVPVEADLEDGHGIGGGLRHRGCGGRNSNSSRSRSRSRGGGDKDNDGSNNDNDDDDDGGEGGSCGSESKIRNGKTNQGEYYNNVDDNYHPPHNENNHGDISNDSSSKRSMRREPWIQNPDLRETPPNIELYSVLVGKLPQLSSEVNAELLRSCKPWSTVVDAAAAAAAAPHHHRRRDKWEERRRAARKKNNNNNANVDLVVGENDNDNDAGNNNNNNNNKEVIVSSLCSNNGSETTEVELVMSSSSLPLPLSTTNKKKTNVGIYERNNNETENSKIANNNNNIVTEKSESSNKEDDDDDDDDDDDEDDDKEETMLINWQLEVVKAFFHQCIPPQPGYTSSVAAVTILPDGWSLAFAWRKWIRLAKSIRRLRYIRCQIQELEDERRSLLLLKKKNKNKTPTTAAAAPAAPAAAAAAPAAGVAVRNGDGSHGIVDGDDGDMVANKKSERGDGEEEEAAGEEEEEERDDERGGKEDKEVGEECSDHNKKDDDCHLHHDDNNNVDNLNFEFDEDYHAIYRFALLSGTSVEKKKKTKKKKKKKKDYIDCDDDDNEDDPFYMPIELRRLIYTEHPEQMAVYAREYSFDSAYCFPYCCLTCSTPLPSCLLCATKNSTVAAAIASDSSVGSSSINSRQRGGGGRGRGSSGDDNEVIISLQEQLELWREFEEDAIERIKFAQEQLKKVQEDAVRKVGAMPITDTGGIGVDGLRGGGGGGGGGGGHRELITEEGRSWVGGGGVEDAVVVEGDERSERRYNLLEGGGFMSPRGRCRHCVDNIAVIDSEGQFVRRSDDYDDEYGGPDDDFPYDEVDNRGIYTVGEDGDDEMEEGQQQEEDEEEEEEEFNPLLAAVTRDGCSLRKMDENNHNLQGIVDDNDEDDWNDSGNIPKHSQQRQQSGIQGRQQQQQQQQRWVLPPPPPTASPSSSSPSSSLSRQRVRPPTSSAPTRRTYSLPASASAASVSKGRGGGGSRRISAMTTASAGRVGGGHHSHGYGSGLVRRSRRTTVSSSASSSSRPVKKKDMSLRWKRAEDIRRLNDSFLHTNHFRDDADLESGIWSKAIVSARTTTTTTGMGAGGGTSSKSSSPASSPNRSARRLGMMTTTTPSTTTRSTFPFPSSSLFPPSLSGSSKSIQVGKGEEYGVEDNEEEEEEAPKPPPPSFSLTLQTWVRKIRMYFARHIGDCLSAVRYPTSRKRHTKNFRRQRQQRRSTTRNPPPGGGRDGRQKKKKAIGKNKWNGGNAKSHKTNFTSTTRTSGRFSRLGSFFIPGRWIENDEIDNGNNSNLNVDVHNNGDDNEIDEFSSSSCCTDDNDDVVEDDSDKDDDEGPEIYDSTSNFAVVTFTSRQAAVAARHCLADGRGANHWFVRERMPVGPITDAASMDLCLFRGHFCRPLTPSLRTNEKRLRTCAGRFSLFVVYVFYIVPIAWASTLVNPNALNELIGNLAISHRLSNIIPGILQNLFFVLCPALFKGIANSGSNATTLASAESAALQYYWWFMVVTAFSGSSIATAVNNILTSANLHINLTAVLLEVAATVPIQTSAAWISWILVRSLITLPLVYLLQGVSFILRFFGCGCCYRLTLGAGAGKHPQYRIYIDSGVVFMCATALSFASPLVAPCALIYFLVVSPLFRRNFIFVYRMKFDCGGSRWPFLFDVCMSSMLVGQVLLFSMLVLKRALGPALLAILPVFPTAIFWKSCKRRFVGGYNDAGLLQTSMLDDWDDTLVQTPYQQEEFRKFLVDAHKAAYLPVCIAGDAARKGLTAEPASVVATAPSDVFGSNSATTLDGGVDGTAAASAATAVGAVGAGEGVTTMRRRRKKSSRFFSSATATASASAIQNEATSSTSRSSSSSSSSSLPQRQYKSFMPYSRDAEMT